jgi:hypothetical protein
VGSEHQVEQARIRERLPLSTGRALIGVVEFVETKPVVTVAAFNERVGEDLCVT